MRNKRRGPREDPVVYSPVLDPQFEEDLRYWQATDPKVAARLMRIFQEILRSPFEGIGKPKALRANLAGYWSRRLTQEHRVVYRVADRTIVFMSARFHY